MKQLNQADAKKRRGLLETLMAGTDWPLSVYERPVRLNRSNDRSWPDVRGHLDAGHKSGLPTSNIRLLVRH